MLTVCVPHYNFVNPKLFESLYLQCKAAGVYFEIIIIDDASTNSKKDYLNNFKQPEFKIYFLKENIGRSAIRNLLAAKAKYPYLLFLDADAELINTNFIFNYLNNLCESIVYGGRIYAKQTPEPNYFLHYKYGSQVEQYAESQFQSNNFLIQKAVFSSLVFDDELKGYGYEDVLFGLGAKRLGIALKKIDNPVKHIQLKTNEEFVKDMEQALRNLNFLIIKKKDWRLEDEVNVSAVYKKLKRYRVVFLLNYRLEEILRKSRELLFLNIPIGATLLTAVYKLYYFHYLQKR
ncbi:MAG TPA: glycosyltransferase [Pelobium sp.]